VEIRGNGETRGGWPLFSEEDLVSAYQLAREMGCTVQMGPDAQKQLSLFEGVDLLVPLDNTGSAQTEVTLGQAR
jgi:hypothetical protein